MTQRLFVTILFALFISSSALAQDDPTITRLYDTVIQSPSQMEQRLNKLNSTEPTTTTEPRFSWPLIPEDTTTHTFRGDVLFMNDKLAVVLSKESAAIYSKAGSGFVQRASIPRGGPENFNNFKIVENGSGAVAIECISQSSSLRFRLTTGEGTLEILPGKGLRSISVSSLTDYAVVPDFFGDDLVYHSNQFNNRALPAENMCINMLHGGAMMMCVWQSKLQNTWLSGFGESPERTLIIDSRPDQKIWLSFMEGKDLWQTQDSGLHVKYKPPFRAKWRCDEIQGTAPGVAHSWDAEGAPAQLEGRRGLKRIIYPLDREQDTPITTVLPTDVMRNTLGVGPCQYILAVEGMQAEGDPTPNNVMEWVEKQFEQKKEKKAADDIKERLDVMCKHIAEAKGRIKAYADFATAATPKLAADPEAGPWMEIVNQMTGYATSGLAPAASPDRANKLAAGVIALEGKPDAAAECKKLGEQLREVGETQDRALARCRMAVRRLKQEGRTMNGSIKTSAAVADIQKQAEAMFSKSIEQGESK